MSLAIGNSLLPADSNHHLIKNVSILGSSSPRRRGTNHFLSDDHSDWIPAFAGTMIDEPFDFLSASRREQLDIKKEGYVLKHDHQLMVNQKAARVLV